MQSLKVFIVIEGESGKDDLRIDGNLETLRAFLLGVGNFEIHDEALTTSLLASHVTASQPVTSRRKVKSKKSDKGKLKYENTAIEKPTHR